MDKQPFIIYDGPSGSGKTTLLGAVDVFLGYPYLSVARLTPSQWVYGTLRGDEGVTAQVEEFERALMRVTRPLLVYTFASPEVLLERMHSREEYRPTKVLELTQDDLAKVLTLFLLYYTKLSILPRIMVDTTKTIQQCIDVVVIEMAREFSG